MSTSLHFPPLPLFYTSKLLHFHTSSHLPRIPTQLITYNKKQTLAAYNTLLSLPSQTLAPCNSPSTMPAAIFTTNPDLSQITIKNSLVLQYIIYFSKALEHLQLSQQLSRQHHLGNATQVYLSFTGFIQNKATTRSCYTRLLEAQSWLLAVFLFFVGCLSDVYFGQFLFASNEWRYDSCQTLDGFWLELLFPNGTLILIISKVGFVKLC